MQNITFRPYRLSDKPPLHALKNDLEVRKNSRTSREYSVESFELKLAHWLGAKIFSVVELEGIFSGQVVLEDRGDGKTDLHFTVTPNYRSMGIGKKMVHQFIAERSIDVSDLVLVIKEGNIRSERIAQSLGLFRVMGSEHVTEVGQPPIVEWAMPTIGQA